MTGESVQVYEQRFNRIIQKITEAKDGFISVGNLSEVDDLIDKLAER